MTSLVDLSNVKKEKINIIRGSFPPFSPIYNTKKEMAVIAYFPE